MLMANVFILIFGMFGAKQYAKITKVPSSVLIPIIAALCMLGAFSYRNLPFVGVLDPKVYMK